jgi:hypothetical protein
VLLSSGDSFPHLIQKPSSQLGFVTYLLNRARNIQRDVLPATVGNCLVIQLSVAKSSFQKLSVISVVSSNYIEISVPQFAFGLLRDVK